MKRTVTSYIVWTSGVILLGPIPLVSQEPSLFQELGVFAISAQSDHVELPSPIGFGASSVWEFAGHFLARVSYHRVSDDTRKEGVVCDNYSQRIHCRPEITQTSVVFSGLRGALLVAVPLGGQVRLGAGGGMSFNHVNTESVGTESGLRADLLSPNAGVLGFSALFSVAVMPIRAVPVLLTGGFGVHWANFDTCSATDPPQYDPYCGRDSLREIELGLSYMF